jgi:RimJ/RimL family protein N-acetyltransferase
VQKLAAAEYRRVISLFAGMAHNRAPLFSVIEGRTPGSVLVDRAAAPTAACVLVGSVPTDFFLGGSEGSTGFNLALRDHLVTEILPRVSGRRDAAHLMFYSVSAGWRNVLRDLLEEYGVRRLTRTQFAFHPERFAKLSGWRERLPEGYHVERADRRLAEGIPGIADLWGSVDNFLSGGFFFCVVKAGEMISRSGSVFVGEGRVEIGVETAEGYRRQGFATLASCACIEHCLEMGLRPEWGCYYNPASGALAKSLGFAERPGTEVNYVRIEAAR